MASLRVGKSAILMARRCLIRPNIRTMAAGGGIPEHSEHVTGLEKKEMEMIKAGNPDPFELQVKRVPAGTQDKPVAVKSVFEKRIVGCICEEEQTFINWMWLHAGEAQRCDCGHWFQLQKTESI
ncbi:cytochrome c oxidase subunit 5B, mitochondrial-like [Patiria miniata]|uniref:Mitochondrial cytochrome c oxidase subunit Vb n=1 Tax=Patiria miniata TaxID=46514 RepID=A0A913ZYN3_PATMI|nr:cytochrome c oxidase subunit 5B, mitochondrial-like [Patiria miniata]